MKCSRWKVFYSAHLVHHVSWVRSWNEDQQNETVPGQNGIMATRSFKQKREVLCLQMELLSQDRLMEMKSPISSIRNLRIKTAGLRI